MDNYNKDDPWERYGLIESPYNTSPMRLVGLFPIGTVFYGRNNEVRTLKRILNSSNSSRTLITGDFAVGKTTFANFVRWDLCLKSPKESRFITTNYEVKVQPSWDQKQFLISTLAAIYNASKVFPWDDIDVKIPSLTKLEPYLTITQDSSTSANIGSIGFGHGKISAGPTELATEILEDFLQSICSELVACNREIIIQYNNLENVENDKISILLKSIREYLQIEGFHSLFLGPPRVISGIERFGEVHSVFSPNIFLDSLNSDEVIEILKRRCESLKLPEGNYLLPFEPQTVLEVYNKLNNIRFTFKVLEDATIMLEDDLPVKISMKEVMTIHKKEKKSIFSKLTEIQSKIITLLFEEGELNITTIARKIKIPHPNNLTTPIAQLESSGLIVISKDPTDLRQKLVKISDNSNLKIIFSFEKDNIEKNKKDKNLLDF